MKKVAELFKDNKSIGFLFIIDDSNGGGLNGGIRFSNDGIILSYNIPLFEKSVLLNNK